MWFNALGRLALGQASKDGAVVADLGAFALEGQDAALSAAIKAAVGEFALSGADADLRYRLGRNLTASASSFSTTGQPALFNVLFRSPVGEFVVSGQSSSRVLRVSGGAGSYSVVGYASARALSIGGTSATFAMSAFPAGLDLVAPSQVGAFAVTGRSATVQRGLVLYATNATATLRSHVMFAPLGGVAIGEASYVAPNLTTYSYSGQSVEFFVRTTLVADAGSFLWQRIAADLSATVYPSNIRVFPRVGSGLRGFSRGGGVQARGATGRGVKIRAFGG